jgi:two-component system nitrogen regulation sensor histidine kinase NtrY
VSQALVNILKNAAESIQARDGEAPPGHITLSARGDGHDLVVAVEDNGRGLPQEGRDRLTEPYVTTRAKGTGLGLAIVKKIMEDHSGELILEDRDGGGARVKLVFREADLRLATTIEPAEPAAKAALYGA